jgi:predicted enzyme related to lactoylglutathione lyase
MATTRKPVVHLELHTGDPARASEFYAEFCGWRSERIVAGDQSYTALELGGGFGGGGGVECDVQQPLWLPYVQVDDIHAATEQARELGAAILLEPREGPVGRRSVVTTPASGDLALWEPRERPMPSRRRSAARGSRSHGRS